MLRIKKAEFVTSCSLGSPLPELGDAVQIAMVGKSNVGKSSFINALCNNAKLARTSATPGKTRLINFYSVNGGDFYLVDLPGYGYAKVSRADRQRWAQLMETFFRENDAMALGILIVDARHDPTEDDRQMAGFLLQSGTPLVVLANKADKLNKTQLEACPERIFQALSLPEGCPVLPFSAEKRTGRDRLISIIENIG